LNSTYWNLVFQVELEPSEYEVVLSLNSTYWNLVFQEYAVMSVDVVSFMFELHLLESGISGLMGQHPDRADVSSLNSTYWNLVFQDKLRSTVGERFNCLNSTYWNLVFQAKELYLLPLGDLV